MLDLALIVGAVAAAGLAGGAPVSFFICLAAIFAAAYAFIKGGSEKKD